MNRKQNSLMRFSRTERLAQLSEQEIVIERKKKEIQAKIEAQKRKETEEALKKLESSKATKNNKPGFSKKSWSGIEHQKINIKEKPINQVKKGLTNAFSNDGSFLDQFKKLSQKGLSPDDINLQALPLAKKAERDLEENVDRNEENKHKDVNEKPGNETFRHKKGSVAEDHEIKFEDVHSSVILKNLDSKLQLQKPSAEVAQSVLQHDVSVVPSVDDDSSSVVPSLSVQTPQFQGVAQHPPSAFKNMQLNSSYSNYSGTQAVPPVQLLEMSQSFNSRKQDNATFGLNHHTFSTNEPASIQPPLPKTQNLPLSLNVKTVQNVPPPPPVVSSELPKLRSESISMTLKINTVKKLEPIPNPLEIEQMPLPVSQKKIGLLEKKESLKGTSLNTSQNLSSTPVLENVSSLDRESPSISSAFNDCDEDEEEEEGGDLLDEKLRHWAELVASSGDGFEESLRERSENNPNLRFLLYKNSKEYLSYRKLVLKYRMRSQAVKQEPSEKMRKLNFPKIGEESFAEKTLSRISNDISYDTKELLGSEKMASAKQQEIKTNIFNDDDDDYDDDDDEGPFLYNRASGLTSKKDCFLASQKQSPFKETSCEITKEQTVQNSDEMKTEERRKRKRKSRWGDVVSTVSPPVVATNLQSSGIPASRSTLLSQLTRSDPGLMQYARQTFGSTNLSEEDWKKAEDHYKINLLYQDMVKKRAEVEKLEKQGKFKYEYDSDEDTEGGTWEHKLRQQEMQATQLWAEELTRQAAGKHHIGDFLPPEELERFMEKYNAVKEGREPDLSDYKEYKLKQDNVGYRLLQKMGWNEGQGLGQDGSGITNPVNKATTRHENQGLGVERPDGLEAGDDEYDAYRKRMMLAYRFRPNPLNNPRRPYY